MAPREQRLALSAEIASAEEQCVAQERQAGVARAARRELSAVEVEVARLEKVVEREPRHATAWEELGLAYRRAGRLADAARALRTQVDVAPRHPAAWTELGIVASEQGRLDEAEAAFRRQLEVAPRDGYARLKLGVTLLDLGRPKEALRELEPVAAAAPDEAPVLLAAGRARLGAGQVERGVAALERAVGLDPGASTWEEAARALADAGADLDDARAWAASAASDLTRRLRDAAPDAVTGDDVARSAALVRAWATLGWIRLQQGELADAERLLRAAERLQPSAVTSERLGRALERAGKPDDAERAYARAVALGASGHARSRLAVLARDEGAAVAAAREDLARGAIPPADRPAVRLARAAATPADADILLVLRADGAIAAVLVTDGAAVDGAGALVGGRHGVAFPDASLPMLVATARWRCGASGCAASFAPAAANPR
jgi:tetratricopeptide (TPR) repeat protein